MNPPTPAPHGWVSAHVFHAGDLDELITRMAGPLTTDLKPDRFFFLRYWEGGPHLRLRLRATGPRDAEHTRREIAGRGRAYLAAHPSTRALTPVQYARMASRQAGAERMAEHDARLHPNDSVEFIDYRPEHHAYGDPVCMAAVETHVTQSSRITLDILHARPGPQRRAATSLAAVTLTMAACHTDPGVLRPDLPPPLEKIYTVRRDDLLRQAHQLLTAHPGGVLGAWADSIHTLRHALTQAECRPRDAGSPLGFLARAVPPEHRPVAEVLLRCTHLLNNRLGLPPAPEHRVALLAARALSDATLTEGSP